MCKLVKARCLYCNNEYTISVYKVTAGQRYCSVSCAQKGKQRAKPASIRTKLLRSINVRPYGCWEWTKVRHKGYGQLTINYKQYRAHRLAYEEFVGPIPPGMIVMHGCDNPACINPAHLMLGTHKDNTQDAVRKHRMTHGERCHSARVTEAVVREIRALYNQRPCFETTKHIMEAYGLSYNTVYPIVNGKTWKHVTTERQ